MKTDDLPESKNLVDRRGKPEPKTLNEHIARAGQEAQPDPVTPDPNSTLARQAGVKVIA